MEVVKFNVKGKKALQLSVMKVEPEGTPKGIFHIFHDMGEYKERYTDFSMFLAKNGYVVYVHDHRKHGASLDRIEDLGIFTKDESWVDIVDDCYLVSRFIKKEQEKIPYIILGHSMGSIIARDFLSKYEGVAQKAIIMAPPPSTSNGDIFSLVAVGGLLNMINKKNKTSDFLAEKLNKRMLKDYDEPRTDFDWLCTDEAVVDAYVEDPLCGFNYTAKFYIELAKAAVNVNKNDKNFEISDLPLLFIGGDEDPVGENGEAVKEVRGIYSGYAFVQLQYKLFKGMRHEVLNETKKQEVYDYILQWIGRE